MSYCVHFYVNFNRKISQLEFISANFLQLVFYIFSYYLNCALS